MEFITNNINALLVAGLGGVLVFCVDRVLYFIILKLYPDMFFKDVARNLNNALEDLKKKYPEAGKVAETKIITSLNEAIKIIES